MRHMKDSNRLGRMTSHRKSMLKNIVTSLILAERIETTLIKAKVARRLADRMVTLAKKKTLHARRHAARWVRDPLAVQKLFAELAVRFQDRHGGYTRIYHLGQRLGDGARMAILEYLGAPQKAARPVKVATKSTPAKKAASKKEPSKKEVLKRAEKKEDKPLKKMSSAPERESMKPSKPKGGLLARLGVRRKPSKKD